MVKKNRTVPSYLKLLLSSQMFKQRKLKHNRKHPNGSEQFSSSPSAQLDCHCLFGVLQELNSHFFSNGGCLDHSSPNLVRDLHRVDSKNVSSSRTQSMHLVSVQILKEAMDAGKALKGSPKCLPQWALWQTMLSCCFQLCFPSET